MLAVIMIDKIMQELYGYWLSDAPSDCESDRSSNDDSDVDFRPSTSQKGRRSVMLDLSDSDVNTDDDDVVDDLTKNDDLRDLEQYLGNTGLTLTPDDPTSTSEVVNRFLENVFLFL